MDVHVGEVISRADDSVSGIGHAPSTLWQYRWAWSQIELFCSREGVVELTDDVVASFLRFVAAEHREGRIKEWKRKLLRKAVLVLSEVASTGTYTWKLSRATHPNDVVHPGFRPVQEQFEQWLRGQGLAAATADLYATVSRKVMAWLPERGVDDVARLSGADVSAAVVYLAGSYRPASMRTAVTALRAFCRFVEDSGRCVGLSRAVPAMSSRRSRPVSVLPAHDVEALVASPDPTTPVGRRNRAILLLAARTGLRPGDIAGLRLADIDWRQSLITVTQQKTATVLTLPLLADVGTAIAEYLLHGRPAGVDDDHVFLRSQAPFAGHELSDLYHVASDALARTKTAPDDGGGRGMRVLRASLATRMVKTDTPLPVISQALGHREIVSTTHYLAADETRMRQCCLDFAGIEPRTVAR
ncbi:MAG: tyrosine-type recombinase/integrase [Sciscionella sp.]